MVNLFALCAFAIITVLSIRFFLILFMGIFFP
jgi:hypothetical protein